jgi:very-short-patch-repair endonuclease
MINIKDPRCNNCQVFIVQKAPFLCSYCKADSAVKKRLKKKELQIHIFLEDKKYSFVSDRRTGVCGNFRPDFLIDCGTHVVVIECDEYQHNTYEQDCEEVRMVNIQQSLGIYTVFIRYNPDTFSINGKQQKVSQEERLKILKERIDYHITKPLDKHMHIEYLFYSDK